MMQQLIYISIGLSGVLIVLVGLAIVLLIKKTDTKSDNSRLINEQKEAQNDLKLYFGKEYGNLKFEMAKLFNESNKVNQTDLYAFKEKMVQTIDQQINQINNKVEQRLGEGFKQTNETFMNVVERLAKIDEAQKTIEKLSTEVVSLNILLTDKKTRGTFGEVQLYQLLSAVLGDKKEVFEKQKKLSNGAIADAVIYAPDPLGMIAIDSKFPLENYRKMMDRKLSDNERKQAEKEFKKDVKKHIDVIKYKYIITGETAEQAFMFIPAEAIFAELSAYHEDLIDYANSKRVWIASPTTLLSTLTIIQVVINNIETSNQAKRIIEELNKFGTEFSRYRNRWDKLKRNIDTVSKSADEVHTTSKKITTKFENISKGKLVETEQIDFEESKDEEVI